MEWWCSATDASWRWAWRPYPGVWLFVLLFGGLVWKQFHRAASAHRARGPMVAGAVVSVWIALDWPVGTLGAGYLLSAHQLQYVLLVMIAPPLLWWADAVPAAPEFLRPAGAWLAHPVPAILVCNAIVVGTHLPSIVDALMPTQVGSFALDMSWLWAGFVLWRPVFEAPPHNAMSYPARFGYLLVATLIPGVLAAFFFFADYPIYSLYELAPPVEWMPVMQDQFVGGIIMKTGSVLVVLTALSVVFYRWYLADRGVTEAVILPSPLHDSDPR